MNYIRDLQENPEAKPTGYWKNTSDNSIIRSFIDIAGSNITEKLEILLSGGYLKEHIDENLIYDYLHSSEENLWSVLYLTGYLTRLLRMTISYHDDKEDFYHAFLAGIFAGAGYVVQSNKEHGEGRSDIVVLDSRNVLVRRGFATNEIMVVLVVASPVFPSKNNFVKALRKKFPQITTVVLNVNDKKTSMVLGERDIVIYGKGFIRDTLCGCSFRISPQSFYQVNPVQTEILYRTAIEYAGLGRKETVIDAYCGIGTIGLVAAKKAKTVIGVELNPDAVHDAKLNAKENKITNAHFYQGDAGEFMEAMAAEGEHADVVFMDPPRTGSDKKFMSSVVTLNPSKIVYVSCGPETLARDLEYLTKHGYDARKIQPVDMFSFTDHCETVCLLTRKFQR